MLALLFVDQSCIETKFLGEKMMAIKDYSFSFFDY